MKFYMLPLSTRRSLLYCVHRSTKPPTYLDKASTKIATFWLSWERSEKNWQRSIVQKGNQLMSRIPYEEWSLKQIPSLKEPDLPDSSSKVQLCYPPTIIQPGTIAQRLSELAASRQNIHKSHLIWSFVGMPIVAPFALVPVIPNLPFFYLAYRAFSHYKALLGISHLKHLLSADRFEYLESEALDKVFRDGARGAVAGVDGVEQDGEERMLLGQAEGKKVAEAIGEAEVGVEWERAWGQVERDIIKKRKEGGLKVEEKDKSA